MHSWWRHQMETFSALLALCAGNSPVSGEFPSQKPVTRSFDVFFDLRLNKRLSKQPWGWWFETLSWSLWRHRNVSWLSCYPRISQYVGWTINEGYTYIRAELKQVGRSWINTPIGNANIVQQLHHKKRICVIQQEAWSWYRLERVKTKYMENDSTWYLISKNLFENKIFWVEK